MNNNRVQSQPADVPDQTEPQSAAPSRSQRLRALVGEYGRPIVALGGTAVGLAFLWLVLQWADVTEIVRLAAGMDWAWIASALIVYSASLTIRAARWQLLMHGPVRLRYSETLVALVTGYAVNNVLPARLGELVRADFCKRAYGMSRTRALASIIVERFLDGVAVIGVFACGFALLEQSGGVVDTLRYVLFLGLALYVVIGVLIWFIGGGRFPLPRFLGHWVAERMRRLSDSFQVVRRKAFYAAALITVAIWSSECIVTWAVVRALGISLDPVILLCLIGAASLSTLVPSAPAFTGTYHAAFAMVFGLGELSVSAGVTAATTVQFTILAPVTVVGFGMLARTLVR